MSIPGSANPLLLASAAAAGGYEIGRSVRLNSADSAYFSRTPASSGNRKTWTWSGWVKRSAISTGQAIFTAGTTTSNECGIYFWPDNAIGVDLDYVTYRIGVPVYRDPSAWFHIVFVLNTPDATADNRFRVFVNNVEQSTTKSLIAQNAEFGFNTAIQHEIGRFAFNSSSFLNGYLADIHFIDGQALDPTSFGEFDTNGVWQPKAYTGTYGTNGFHLDFADNSNNTAAALGKDTSGNGNNWTPNNLSAAASGPNYTSMTTAWWDQNTTPRPYLNKNAYDGNSGTFAGWPSDSNPPSTTGLTVLTTFSSPISYSSSVVVECLTGGPSATKLRLNGTNYPGGSINISGSGTISTLQWGYDPGAWNAAYSLVQRVIVDGVVLVDFTPAGNDSLVDSPTNYGTDTGVGGEVRGNYATLNPLTGGSSALSNGNLQVTSTTAYQHRYGTIGVSSGKWYWEHVFTASTTAGAIGISNDISETGSTYNGIRGYLSTDGNKYAGTTASSYGSTWTVNDVLGIALDMDAGSITFYKNGVSQGVAFTGLTGTWFPLHRDDGNSTAFLNFGQRPFAFSAPSGFKALCTANLP